MRFPRCAAVIAILILLLAGASVPGRASFAQEATPGAGTTEAAAEPEFQYLAALDLAGVPYTPAVINVAGATFAPGSMTPFGPDPFATFTYVESGTISLLAGEAVTVFPDGLAGPGVPGERADADVATPVHAGEAFLTLPGVPYQLSNAGDEAAEVVFLLLLPPDEESEATPVASPSA